MLIKSLDIYPQDRTDKPNRGMQNCNGCPLASDTTICGAVAINGMMDSTNELYSNLVHAGQNAVGVTHPVASKMLGEAVARGVSPYEPGGVVDRASAEIVACEGAQLQYTAEALQALNDDRALYYNDTIQNSYISPSYKPNLLAIPNHLEAVKNAAAK